ncbi:MAG: hypothetical protein OXU20_02835, partial [Myxococcales bacterium]|nr:hypothetical protein [Myxococcales bacterium]MDD9972183.1 hypothetical protein [Myxococcales bacterium]
RVIRQSEGEEHGIDWRMLQHVSPIEWDNVVLYGQYVLNRSSVRKRRRQRRAPRPERELAHRP